MHRRSDMTPHLLRDFSPTNCEVASVRIGRSSSTDCVATLIQPCAHVDETRQSLVDSGAEPGETGSSRGLVKSGQERPHLDDPFFDGPLDDLT